MHLSRRATAAIVFILLAGLLSARRSAADVIHDQPADSQTWTSSSVQQGTNSSSASVTTVQPQLLGEWAIDKTPNFLWGFSTIMTNLDKVRIAFGPGAGFSTGAALFDDVSITTADIGRTFTADIDHNLSFPTVTQLLTNRSTSDTVFVVTGKQSFGAAGAEHPESFWASNPVAPADFSGYQITSIGLYINNVSFTSPGSNPNGNGNWTDFMIDRKLRFYGVPLPEPAMGAGLVVLMMVGMRRQSARG